MTRDELRAALLEEGWEEVSVMTFAEWLGHDPVLLSAYPGGVEDRLCVKVSRGSASAIAQLTTDLLAHDDTSSLVRWTHDRLRRAWADAVWDASAK